MILDVDPVCGEGITHDVFCLRKLCVEQVALELAVTIESARITDVERLAPLSSLIIESLTIHASLREAQMCFLPIQ